MSDHQNIPDNPLDNDGEENIEMENELLRLKLKAELGGDSFSNGNLDPTLENQFLKQVLAFEHSYAKGKRVKIFDLLGKPDFKSVSELTDGQLDFEFKSVLDLLAQNNIAVDFSGDYDNRLKYSFIIEELVDHETDDFKVPGMITHFSYEEFHPNHKLDIENRAIEFLTGWFEQGFDERNWCLDDPFILPDRKTLSKVEITQKFRRIFDSYSAFTDYEYKIDNISFELNEQGGLGHAEGYTKYNAILENNDKIIISGPFKLYLSLQYGWWSIFYIVFPGLEY
jgi:hypothetical protein